MYIGKDGKGGEIALREIAKRLGTLESKTNTVMARAANRAATAGATVIRRETAKRYWIDNQRDLKEAERIKKAYPAYPTAVLDYTGRHNNLYVFSHHSVSPRVAVRWPKGKYVSTRVKKTEDWKALSKEPAAFVRTVKSGRTLLLHRKGHDRQATLEGDSAPSIPQIIRNEDTMVVYNDKVDQVLQNRIDHEIEQILRGRG